MKKGEENRKKDSMNLQKMYEQKLTPQRKVEAFRRFVIRLKKQKNLGRELNDRDYFQVDITLFREEALYMKGFCAEADMQIRLTKEIRCLEEMTDEQILCYYTLVKRFRKNIMERVSMAYARYYMLEVVNLIYQETAKEACEVLFSFWDALNRKKKVSVGCMEYFCQLCQLFMLAHQEVMPDMVRELECRTKRDWSGKVFVQIEQGDYSEAARFVQQNARLLKEEEIWSDAEYVRYTWEAMPCVFRELEKNLSEYDFRHMIMNGFYVSAYIGDYPVNNASDNQRKQVIMSAYMYYEYQEYSDYWRFWYYVLWESVQDLLNLIRQYTRTCIRQCLKLAGKKSSPVRLLKKNYTGDADVLKNVEQLKTMVADPRFEAAVKEGVRVFFQEHAIPLPERKRRKRLPREQKNVDYEEAIPVTVLDPEKLRKAREDADSVLEMLSDGEIDYEGGERYLSATTETNIHCGSGSHFCGATEADIHCGSGSHFCGVTEADIYCGSGSHFCGVTEADIHCGSGSHFCDVTEADIHSDSGSHFCGVTEADMHSGSGSHFRGVAELNSHPDSESCLPVKGEQNCLQGTGDLVASALPEIRDWSFKEAGISCRLSDQEKQESAAGDKEYMATVCWSPEEQRYLYFLKNGDQKALSDHLHTLQIPENVMMKQINEKALVLLDDILLERREGVICVLEEYEEEVDRILRERS